MTKKVAVLMGGFSAEREVSLASGAQCALALKELGHEVIEIDVKRDIAQVLDKVKPDVVFNALHGSFGEDGTVQGVLETLQIPYTHSGILSSALAMDKHQSKIMFKNSGIPVADHIIANRSEIASKHIMKPPYVIKPVAEGSSVGIFLVKSEVSHPVQEILGTDWKGGEELMVERFVDGRELTCAVMGNVALGVIEITTEMNFYNYEAKYEQNGSQHLLPAPVSQKIYKEVQQLSLKAHKALGCKGITRADFRFNDFDDENGEIVCLEINTQPGMTKTSLVPEIAAHAGHDFKELVGWILEDASCNR